MAVENITGVNFKKMTAEGVSVVDFFAIWCGPCRALEPIVEKLSDELAGKVKFFSANIDDPENIQLTTEYQIRSVPTLLLFKDGALKSNLVGPESREEILNWIEKHR